MATAPYCFPHPSAATYPPNFSAGYYPPLFSSDPAPAPGFFPTPSYESSPGASHGRPPDPNHHTHASAFAFPDLWSTAKFPFFPIHAPTQIPNHPSPAAIPVHGDLYHAPPAFPCPISASVYTPAYASPANFSPAPPTSPPPAYLYASAASAYTDATSSSPTPAYDPSNHSSDHLLIQAAPQPTAALSAPNHRPLQLTPTDYRLELTAPPTPVPPTTGAPVGSATPANAVQRHAAPSTTSSGRLPDFTMGDDNGGATFQIEKRGNTTTTAAHVAGQVFAEMPTPISWQETHGTASDYCSLLQTPIQSSCMQDKSTNLSEQNLNAMPVYDVYGDEQQVIEQPPPMQVLDEVPSVHDPKVAVQLCNSEVVQAVTINHVQQAAKKTMVSQASALGPAEEAVQDHLVREIVHIQKRLQQQEYSVQFIQGEVAELSHRVAQIGISLGMQHIQDGTILSQASCFAIQQDVQFSEMPIGDVNAETDGYLFKNEIPSQPSPVSATATDQTQFQTTEKMPVYDVYEEDTNASPHGVVELSETVGQHRQYDSKKLGATKLSSWESDNEVLAVCFDNASDNAFSEEATGFSFPHGPVTHTDRSIKLTNEKTTQAASLPCVQEDNMHCHDPRSRINSKKQDALINKHTIIYPSDLNTDKEVPFPLQYQLPLSSAPCIWDPGINLFSYRKLHIFPWIPSSAISILQQVHNKNISSLLEFSLEKGRHVHWDPGIKLLLCELLWLKTMTKGTEYALRQLLALNFGTHDSTYSMDTTATICSPAIIIQQGRNFARVLHFWLPIFNDMHCCQIFQKCNAISSQLCWYQDIKFNGIPLWLINFQVP